MMSATPSLSPYKNIFERKEGEENRFNALKGKYPQKVIEDTRRYIDILDYYYYKAACAATREETERIYVEELLEKKNSILLDDLMDPEDYKIREFSSDINRANAKLRVNDLTFPIENKYEMKVDGMRHEMLNKKGYIINENEEENKKRQEYDRKVFEYLKKLMIKRYGGEP